MNTKDSSVDDSLYFILAFAKDTLYFAAKFQLYCSPVFSEGKQGDNSV